MSFRFMIILTCLLCVGAINASAQMMLQKAAVGAGGVMASNSTQQAGLTAGQAVTGTASNGQTVGHFGFWPVTQLVASAVGQPPALNVAMQTYPNPTSDLATVTISLAYASNLDVQLFDVNGKEVKSVFSGAAQSGTQSLDIDLSGMASGSYILAARIPGQLLENRITVIH
jgi:hypothetical protein